MVGALRDRGIPESAASLAAEAGIAVFKVARARWLSEPGQQDLPEILWESMEELRGVLTDRLATELKDQGDRTNEEAITSSITPVIRLANLRPGPQRRRWPIQRVRWSAGREGPSRSSRLVPG
jgi:hypothetical protein